MGCTFEGITIALTRGDDARLRITQQLRRIASRVIEGEAVVVDEPSTQHACDISEKRSGNQ
jgi:hypothetical protein